MRANQTQHLFQDNDIKFWGNDIWPGNSPDLNVAEHIGSIIKNEVEKNCYPKLNVLVTSKKRLKCMFQMF